MLKVTKFDKGKGVLVFQFDPAKAGSGTGNTPPLVNVLILAPSGSKWTLYDPQRVPSKPGEPPKSDAKPNEEPKPDTKPDTKPGP